MGRHTRAHPSPSGLRSLPTPTRTTRKRKRTKGKASTPTDGDETQSQDHSGLSGAESTNTDAIPDDISHPTDDEIATDDALDATEAIQDMQADENGYTDDEQCDDTDTLAQADADSQLAIEAADEEQHRQETDPPTSSEPKGNKDIVEDIPQEDVDDQLVTEASLRSAQSPAKSNTASAPAAAGAVANKKGPAAAKVHSARPVKTPSRGKKSSARESRDLSLISPDLSLLEASSPVYHPPNTDNHIRIPTGTIGTGSTRIRGTEHLVAAQLAAASPCFKRPAAGSSLAADEASNANDAEDEAETPRPSKRIRIQPPKRPQSYSSVSRSGRGIASSLINRPSSNGHSLDLSMMHTPARSRSRLGLRSDRSGSASNRRTPRPTANRNTHLSDRSMTQPTTKKALEIAQRDPGAVLQFLDTFSQWRKQSETGDTAASASAGESKLVSPIPVSASDDAAEDVAEDAISDDDNVAPATPVRAVAQPEPSTPSPNSSTESPSTGWGSALRNMLQTPLSLFSRRSAKPQKRRRDDESDSQDEDRGKRLKPLSEVRISPPTAHVERKGSPKKLEKKRSIVPYTPIHKRGGVSEDDFKHQNAVQSEGTVQPEGPAQPEVYAQPVRLPGEIVKVLRGSPPPGPAPVGYKYETRKRFETWYKSGNGTYGLTNLYYEDTDSEDEADVWVMVADGTQPVDAKPLPRPTLMAPETPRNAKTVSFKVPEAEHFEYNIPSASTQLSTTPQSPFETRTVQQARAFTQHHQQTPLGPKSMNSFAEQSPSIEPSPSGTLGRSNIFGTRKPSSGPLFAPLSFDSMPVYSPGLERFLAAQRRSASPEKQKEPSPSKQPAPQTPTKPAPVAAPLVVPPITATTEPPSPTKAAPGSTSPSKNTPGVDEQKKRWQHAPVTPSRLRNEVVPSPPTPEASMSMLNSSFTPLGGPRSFNDFNISGTLDTPSRNVFKMSAQASAGKAKGATTPKSPFTASEDAVSELPDPEMPDGVRERAIQGMELIAPDLIKSFPRRGSQPASPERADRNDYGYGFPVSTELHTALNDYFERPENQPKMASPLLNEGWGSFAREPEPELPPNVDARTPRAPQSLGLEGYGFSPEVIAEVNSLPKSALWSDSDTSMELF